jgi:hypothetical protein
MLCCLVVCLWSSLTAVVADEASGVPTNISSSMNRENLDQEAMDTYKYVHTFPLSVERILIIHLQSGAGSHYGHEKR